MVGVVSFCRMQHRNIRDVKLKKNSSVTMYIKISGLLAPPRPANDQGSTQTVMSAPMLKSKICFVFCIQKKIMVI